MSSYVRKHPRFVDEKVVSIEFESKAELQEAWTVDISKGGMYLRTDTPPPHGTRLLIHFSTPDGSLELGADVVHVVDQEASKAFNQPPGIGVQFIDLSAEVRKRFEQYLAGVVERLTGEDGAEDEPHESLETLLHDAHRVMEALASSSLYAALGVDPGASRDEIELRVQTLCERFSDPPPDCSPPKAARLERVARQLERASDLFANPVRRLHYDFEYGHVRAEERRAAGEDFAYLREVWEQCHPERISEAYHLGQAALQSEQTSFEESVKLADRAIELDPFNEDLRHARACWAAKKPLAALATPAEAEPAPPAKDDTVVRELEAFVKKDPAPNHFELLGITHEATAEDVTKAYFARSRRYHPDILRSQVSDDVHALAVELQRRLNVAYRTLSNPATRQAYTNELLGAPDRRAGEALMALEMAKVHLRKGAHAEARELLMRADALDPGKAEVQGLLAWSLIADRNVSRVDALRRGKVLLEQAIETAVKVGPKDPYMIGQFHYYLGRLLRDVDQPKEALVHFEKALALNPHLKEASMERRVIEMRLAKS